MPGVKGQGLIHGHSIGAETPEYKAWIGMKNRCNNINTPCYHNYGGRGISVCERWQNSFVLFLKDMGLRPSSKHSLDRIDVNGNYEPNNCRWATHKIQGNNTRSNVYITYNNKTQTLKQWAEEMGVPYKNLHARINYYKWTIEEAFTLGKQHGSQYYVRPKVA